MRIAGIMNKKERPGRKVEVVWACDVKRGALTVGRMEIEVQ